MNDRRTMLKALVSGLGLAGAAAGQGRRGGQLRTEALSGPFAGYEARWIELVREPGAASKVHRHPGPIFGFVVEGQFRFKVRGGEEQVLGPGDTFFEAFGAIHEVSANGGDTTLRVVLIALAKPGEATSQEV